MTLTLVSVLALLVAGPALAQEGGVIKSGEHADFSRLVFRVDPTTEWSLETYDGEATVFFPGRELRFSTGTVFDLIPRDRIAAISSTIDPRGTTLTLDLACDCRVAASFIKGRHLAIDVKDSRPRTDVADATDFIGPKVEPMSALLDLAADAAEDEEVAAGPGDNIVTPPSAETPEEKALREVELVSSAEDLLIQQIERAASQGLIQLTDPDADLSPSDPPETATAEEIETPAEPPSEPPALAEPAAPPPPAMPSATEEPEMPARAETELVSTQTALAELFSQNQIEARSVYDRGTRAAAERLAELAVPDACREDSALDVGSWTNGLPLHRQVPALSRLIVGEFDRPDVRALSDLARLYIRFGYGREAESLLTGLDAEFEERALLVDLARAVEGRPVISTDGLAIDVDCPGRHGLWLAIGGVTPAYRDAEQFAVVQTAFEDLPPDLRRAVGPGLIVRLLDAGETPSARVILAIIERPSEPTTVELRLAQARVIAAEGRPVEGVQALSALVETNAHNAIEALTAMVRIAVDEKLEIPARTILDLENAARVHRNSPREPELRALLAEALARQAKLGEAMSVIVEARSDLPPSIPMFDALTVELLAAAEPERVGESLYAEMILEHMDRVSFGRENDAARRIIAARLLDLGLANAALDAIEPAAVRGNGEARRIAASAHLRLGNGFAARLLLVGLDDPQATDMRAQAYALGGDFGEAVETLADAGRDADAEPYVWPSGDWKRARDTSETTERVAMASYMGTRAGTIPAAAVAEDPETLPPAEAFQQPLPPLERPSLGSARTLLATSRQVLGFVEGLLKDE